jgi:hypothetical protein
MEGAGTEGKRKGKGREGNVGEMCVENRNNRNRNEDESELGFSQLTLEEPSKLRQ